MRTIYILLIFSFFSFKAECQKSDNVFKDIDRLTIIKDESGNTIDFITFIELTNTGLWIPQKLKEFDNTVQLRKATPEEQQKIIESTLIGETISTRNLSKPKFRMKDLKGNLISSSNTKGKIVVLNFWFTQCKPCILEIPKLNEVYDQFKNNEEVVFAAVTFNKLDRVQSFLNKWDFKYPMVVDAAEICEKFGNIKAYPVNIVLDKQGNYFDYTVGGFSPIGLSATIQNALNK